jgi:hypothetical protein
MTTPGQAHGRTFQAVYPECTDVKTVLPTCGMGVITAAEWGYFNIQVFIFHRCFYLFQGIMVLHLWQW